MVLLYLEPESDGQEKTDPNQPQFGMMKFRRSGKSVNLKSDDPDNPILEIPKNQPEVDLNPETENLEEIYSQKNNGEKIQPMAIGSARSSSRNSFVLK